MYKAVIFDLDGTLADTSPGILYSIRYTQKMKDLSEIILEQLYSHVEPPMEDTYGRNFGLTGERLQQAIVVRFCECMGGVLNSYVIKNHSDSIVNKSRELKIMKISPICFHIKGSWM